jgi:glycosyltransferase involved in cell wall biosynthesis
MLNKADKIISVSNSVANKFKKMGVTAPIEVIYNGVSEPNNTMGDKTIVNKEKIQVSIAGSIIDHKGQLDAVKAVIKTQKFGVNRFILNIYGEGSNEYITNMKNEIAKSPFPENFVFHGYIKDVGKIWKDTDICLVCSKSEAFGRVTVEAMMYGCLVIGANSGGTAELIKDGNTGYLYPVNDDDCLARTLIDSTINSEKSRKIAENGRKQALEQFTKRKNALKIYEAYKKIIP